MNNRSAREKSIEKIRLLRDPLISAAFTSYFERNWPAQGVLDELRSAGMDIERLREWALYSFHPLGTDEAEEKRKRGQMMKTRLKKALLGYKSAIAFYSHYALAPTFNWPDAIIVSNDFKHLVEIHQYLAVRAKTMIENAEAKGLYSAWA